MNFVARLASLGFLLAAWYVGAELAGPRMLPGPLAVATANTGVAGQSIVVAAGKAAMTGAVTSCTLMVWLAVLLLPHPSSAVQVRVTL